MLTGILKLAFMTGAWLCFWLIALRSYRVINSLFRREGLRRALYESIYLNRYAE